MLYMFGLFLADDNLPFSVRIIHFEAVDTGRRLHTMQQFVVQVVDNGQSLLQDSVPLISISMSISFFQLQYDAVTYRANALDFRRRSSRRNAYPNPASR